MFNFVHFLVVSKLVNFIVSNFEVKLKLMEPLAKEGVS